MLYQGLLLLDASTALQQFYGQDESVGYVYG